MLSIHDSQPRARELPKKEATKIKLKIPDGPFQAYLFDCDGTIADSMPLHYVAWRSALAEWKCTFPEELFYAWGGFPIAEIISRLNEKQGLEMPVPEVARRKEELYCGALPQLEAVPEVVEHIDAQWGAFRETPFAYKKGETWDRMVHQGMHLLERFARENRIRIPHPQQDLQLKVVRELPNGNEFLSYVDAIGELDGIRCLMDWKTTTSRYLDNPVGLLSLDPQLICYSWATGISDVALIVFVRKYQPEIQYLKTSISEAFNPDRSFGGT